MHPFALQSVGDLAPIVSDPVSVLLVLLGAVLVGFATLLGGYLTAGGVVAALTTEPEHFPPEQGQ